MSEVPRSQRKRDLPVQFVLLRQSLQLVQNLLPNLRVIKELLQTCQVGRLYALAQDLLDQLSALDRIDDTDEDNVGLQGVAVYEERREQGVKSVDAFDLFQRDIFSETFRKSSSKLMLIRSNKDYSPLTELHNVLHTVNDLQATTVVDYTNVPSVEPSFFVDRLGGVFGILVVALQSHRSADEDFSPSIRLVGRSVLRVRGVS